MAVVWLRVGHVRLTLKKRDKNQLAFVGYKMVDNQRAPRWLSPIGYLTITLRNRAEYCLILSRRGRRPGWLKSDDIRPRD